MPPVDIAMARSLHGGLWGTVKDSLTRSMAAEVVRRDMVNSANDKMNEIKLAFSSWDNCMNAVYCKWPVIAVIAVGGLIVLSILICIIRCACCGVACCCSCFHCLKCCGNCCGCCDPPGGKPHKYLDEPYNPPAQQGYGYRQQAPMEAQFPSAPSPGPGPGPTYASSGPPQYAEFDVSKKNEPDALPAMPTWEDSTSKKMVLEEDGVEMDHLPKKSPSPDRISPMPTVPMGAAAPPMHMGRNGPYDRSQGNSAGYMNAYGQQPLNSYGGQGHGYDPNRVSDGYGLDQPYDAMGSMGPGRQSPLPNPNGYGGPRQMTPGPIRMPQAPLELDGHGSYPTTSTPTPYELDGHGSYPTTSTPAPYGMEPRMRNSPGPGPGQNYRQSPAPQNNHGMSPPRVTSPRQAPYRSYSPAPQSPHAQITNNSGFDFNSGYSRPQTREGPNYDRRPSESRENDEHEAYPGYKPYAPAQQAWSGV